MKITDILKKKKTFSFEFFPPKDEKGLEELSTTIRELSALNPDFVSVTDSDRGSSKYRHLALSKVIKDKTGLNPMLHLTCVNNTRKEITSALENAEELGIENILALRGDMGNFENPGNSDFSHAEDLVRIIGRTGRFCVGVAGHPEKHPEAATLQEDVENLKRKTDLGGEFIITQLFFDNEAFFAYRDLIRAEGITVPLVAGIMPVTNLKNFERLLLKTGAIRIPKSLREIMENHKNDKEAFLKESLAFSAGQCLELLKNGVEAIHFFTFNKSAAAKTIFKELLQARKEPGF